MIIKATRGEKGHSYHLMVRRGKGKIITVGTVNVDGLRRDERKKVVNDLVSRKVDPGDNEGS